MPLKLNVKIVFDFDEDCYRVFIDELKGIEGFGQTEQEALDDFYERLDKELS